LELIVYNEGAGVNPRYFIFFRRTVA
jgi:hypothetical protein